MIGQNDKDAITKLRSVLNSCVQAFGRDPRGGGFSFVAQADYVEQVLKDLPEAARKLRPGLVIGEHGADVVFEFEGVPVCVRGAAKPGVWIMRDEDILPSTRTDRFVASRMRMKAWEGKIVGARA